MFATHPDQADAAQGEGGEREVVDSYTTWPDFDDIQWIVYKLHHDHPSKWIVLLIDMNAAFQFSGRDDVWNAECPTEHGWIANCVNLDCADRGVVVYIVTFEVHESLLWHATTFVEENLSNDNFA